MNLYGLVFDAKHIIVGRLGRRSGLEGFALYFELNRRTCINHPCAVIITFQSNDFGGIICRVDKRQLSIVCFNILVGGYGNIAGISADSVALNIAYRVTVGDKVKFLCAMRSVVGNTGDFYLAVKQVTKGVRTRRAGRSAGVGSIVFFPNGIKSHVAGRRNRHVRRIFDVAVRRGTPAQECATVLYQRTHSSGGFSRDNSVFTDLFGAIIICDCIAAVRIGLGLVILGVQMNGLILVFLLERVVAAVGIVLSCSVFFGIPYPITERIPGRDRETTAIVGLQIVVGDIRIALYVINYRVFRICSVRIIGMVNNSLAPLLGS